MPFGSVAVNVSISRERPSRGKREPAICSWRARHLLMASGTL